MRKQHLRSFYELLSDGDEGEDNSWSHVLLTAALTISHSIQASCAHNFTIDQNRMQALTFSQFIDLVYCIAYTFTEYSLYSICSVKPTVYQDGFVRSD